MTQSLPEHRIKIVVIDDSRADIAVFRRYLANDPEHQYDLKSAPKGADGIALLQQERPDCVLLDFRLPDMSGLDVLETIRVKLKLHSVPIVLLTGSEDESLVVRALKRGAQDYLSKATLSPDNLLRAIHNAIEKVHVLRRLEEALLARDEFLSIASHEMKTPLTTLALQMQHGLLLLKRAQGADLPREAIENIFTRADSQLGRLSSLVNDLLDVSRISAGRLEFNGEEVELSEMVGEVLGHLSDNFAAAGCAVFFEAPEKVAGEFDRFRLEQVVVNLVSNAMKYASGKPVHVSVIREGDQAFVRVRDQGPGISGEQQATIFNRFERGMAPKGTTGLGLGLYIAKQIVDLHQGAFSVQSEEGQGATFTVRLPLRGMRGHDRVAR